MELDCASLSSFPSLNSYSSDKFAEIAAKVTGECNASESFFADTSIDLEDDDFQFAVVSSDHDEIFLGGHQFHETFPIFNRDLLVQDEQDRDAEADSPTLRLPLKKLFAQEHIKRDILSSSESEADEVESLASGTYCIWKPNSVEASPSRCKKSSSTGTASKRWKLLDLLRRNNSEGKADVVILTPKNEEQKAKKTEGIEKLNSKATQSSAETTRAAGKAKAKGVSGAGGQKSYPSASPHEVFYVRCRAGKEGDKRKSYLPYRKDLVGFFT